MKLLDVNVLVYAHREDAENHEDYRAWLVDQFASAYPFGVSELVLSGFLRVVTHPRVFRTPTPQETALAFVEVLRSRDNCVVLAPGERHWGLFIELCRVSRATGNTIPDAYHAALAIETGSEWITTDRGFQRFPELSWRHPLDPAVAE